MAAVLKVPWDWQMAVHWVGERWEGTSVKGTGRAVCSGFEFRLCHFSTVRTWKNPLVSWLRFPKL